MIEMYNCDCIEYLRNNYRDDICIVTDPPFNIGMKYNTYKDKMDENEYFKWLSGLLTMNDYPFVVIHYPESLHKLSINLGIAPKKNNYMVL